VRPYDKQILPDDPVINGLELRTYIATAALQGLLSAPTNKPTANVAAEQAVQYADSLIARLNKL